MIGIPPTCGFFSKLYLILGAIDSEQWFFVAVILFSTALALVYFANVIRYMYFPREEHQPESDNFGGISDLSGLTRHEAPLTMLVPTVLLAVGVILLGFFNGEVVSQFLVPIIPESFLR